MGLIHAVGFNGIADTILDVGWMLSTMYKSKDGEDLQGMPDKSDQIVSREMFFVDRGNAKLCCNGHMIH